jgi:cytoskeletal protein RodZ
MSDEQQPRAEWIFPAEKKRNRGRMWLIIGIVIAGLIIAAVVAFFLIVRGGAATPTARPTTTDSSVPTPPSSTTPTETSPTDPAPTPPPAPSPDIETFTAQVQPRLDDAVRGLQLVRDNLDLGAQIVDSLQNDAATLSDTPAPESVAAEWTDAVAQYMTRLNELRSAYDDGSDPQAPLSAAEAALTRVRAVVGA